jgi:flagellar motor switch protein FliM
MSQAPINGAGVTAGHDSNKTRRAPIINPCNFRYAGRLSNENSRTLTALHEKMAINIANSLEVYLGASLQIKLLSLEQMAIHDYTSSVAVNSYIVPCALNIMECNILLEMDIPLVFPIIDLLLGGSGNALSEMLELTEIDEEIMQSVTNLILAEVGRTWRTLNLALTPGHCIKTPGITQIFPVNEKLVLLMFEMSVGGTTGPFNIILPTSFVGFLLRHLKAGQSKKTSSMHHLSKPSLRERMLECEFDLAVDIVKMQVLVRDLIDLKPGMVLRMKAPIKNQGQITVENVSIFDASPVRSGAMKAAQLLARSQEPAMLKE